jgi:amino-acid N-acetyltransferase
MIQLRPATAQDWPPIERLLRASALPVEGAREHLADFIVAERGGEIVGCAGAEVRGGAALLRSMAVSEAVRGQGVGQVLLDEMLAMLRRRNVKQVALLTTTAERFFARQCFKIVAREDVPAALQGSQEFLGACPADAVAMMLRL